MKSKKLKLSELTIKSFITDTEQGGETIKGGGTGGSFIICESIFACTNVALCHSRISVCLCPHTENGCNFTVNCPTQQCPQPSEVCEEQP